jgi:hypothetical protein
VQYRHRAIHKTAFGKVPGFLRPAIFFSWWGFWVGIRVLGCLSKTCTSYKLPRFFLVTRGSWWSPPRSAGYTGECPRNFRGLSLWSVLNAHPRFMHMLYWISTQSPHDKVIYLEKKK